MNFLSKSHICFLFLFLLHSKCFSQKLTLDLYSKNKEEQRILKKINFNKTHKDSLTLKSELIKIQELLKFEGFFTAKLDSIKKINTTYKAFFSLNEKIKFAHILIKSKDNRKDTLKIPINEVQKTLEKISNDFDKQGKSFSKVKLENLSIKNKILFVDLIINESKERKIDKIVIRGYKKFPKSFLKNYLNLKKNKNLSKFEIERISRISRNIPFIEQIKPPEILFTKDSTSLYLYLKKKSNNSIDAIVSFATLENGSILFNGNIDLGLNNILNTGEDIKLFWNSVAKERQEFKISTTIPYIFNSKISPELNFSIYRQDSTFTNTSFNSILNYNINTKLKLAATYSSKSSKTSTSINSEVTSFSNNFIGLNVNYKILNNDNFQNNKILFNINPAFGRRTSNFNSSDQFKITSLLSYFWKLNFRNAIFIKNSTGYLTSDQYLTNELFRIGGANTIRGFNEQSIFAKNYSYFNIEYQFLISSISYIYTISDIGITDNNENQLFGFGIGYKFIKRKSLFNIGIVNGIDSKSNFNINNSKLIFSWINFF